MDPCPSFNRASEPRQVRKRHPQSATAAPGPFPFPRSQPGLQRLYWRGAD